MSPPGVPSLAKASRASDGSPSDGTSAAAGTCCIVGVDGLALEVEGLDAIDGTPVLDIKPAMRGFLPRDEVREPVWASEIMTDYW